MTKKLSEFAGGGLPSSTLPDPLNPNIRALLDSLVAFWPGNHDPDEKLWVRNRGWLAPDNITGTITHYNYQGGTASFNGSSYLYWDGIDELAFDGSQPFTAICDLYQNVSANDPLFGVGANTSHTGNGWLVMRNLTSDFYLQVNAASGYPTDELQTHCSGGTTSKWHTWGVSYDGSKDETGVNFYRDGASQTRISGANTLAGDATPASSRFYIGTDSSTNNLEGQLGSVYIFDRELTASEMSWMTNGILRPYVEYFRADTAFTLGVNTTGDATAADITSGNIAWVDGERNVGTAPRILLNHLFDGPAATDVSGQAIDHCWGQDGATWLASAGIQTDGAGNIADNGPGNLTLLSFSPTNWPTLDSSTMRVYEYWGQFLSGTWAFGYTPTLRIRVAGDFLSCRFEQNSAPSFRAQIYSWISSSVATQVLGAGYGSTAANDYFKIRVQDRDERVTLSMQTWANGSNSQRTAYTCSLYHTSLLPDRTANAFHVVTEGSHNIKIRGVRVFDETM